jgi:dihydrofolate reductase
MFLALSIQIKLIKMRKLKLEMHMSVDGFVSGPEKQMDWIGTIASDQALGDFLIEVLDSCDTLILGRKTAIEIVKHWEDVADNQPESPEYPVAQKIVSINKIVFSKKQSEISGKNIKVENGDLVAAVQALKNKPGKDILVYGGVSFVNDLVSHNLIDEYILLINPVSLGKGLGIFADKKSLTLKKSIPFKNGVIINTYVTA